MQKAKRTTMAITAERKMKLERMAIDASQKAGKQISWTDLVNHLIDNYSKEAAADLIMYAEGDRLIKETFEVTRSR
ncbi:hypothetical protein [Pectobacterium carotovorum]|uniref:Uncharacterized protein n=1 Tax=Pectobacterium carotovorum TaxID=554 RepID=A0A419AUR6_PECCA|nr:hypothetical protein [Pectobacterium carotovorum]RJL50490.1 hypothetical protein D5071_12965 [Pectobacterium carotovorum]